MTRHFLLCAFVELYYRWISQFNNFTVICSMTFLRHGLVPSARQEETTCPPVTPSGFRGELVSLKRKYFRSTMIISFSWRREEGDWRRRGFPVSLRSCPCEWKHFTKVAFRCDWPSRGRVQDYDPHRCCYASPEVGPDRGLVWRVYSLVTSCNYISQPSCLPYRVPWEPFHHSIFTLDGWILWWHWGWCVPAWAAWWRSCKMLAYCAGPRDTEGWRSDLASEKSNVSFYMTLVYKVYTRYNWWCLSCLLGVQHQSVYHHGNEDYFLQYVTQFIGMVVRGFLQYSYFYRLPYHLFIILLNIRLY